MEKSPKKIAEQIIALVTELSQMAGGNGAIKRVLSKKTIRADRLPIKKGATGALEMLIEEGFFNNLTELGAVMERLKEIGHYHQKTTISMNLLNLTKHRTLNRFKSKETKNWEYVLRK